MSRPEESNTMHSTRVRTQATPSTSAHGIKTLFNTKTDIFLLLAEYFRRDLEVAGLNKALDDLTTHENENVKKRALIILTRIKAHKLAQQE